ncbi:MAG: RNA polymerase sigma factor [Candidatus Saccharicenans sp.]
MSSRQKKEREFEKIIEEFSAFIRCLVLKYNLEKLGLDAEDLIQEIRLKIWKVIDNEKNIHNPASYIKKIVESAVIDQIRRIRKEEEVYTSEKQKLISELEPRSNRYQNPPSSMKEYILKATDRLLESRKIVVQLYLLNMSLPEISAYLNYSPDKTRNLLYRGLSDLKAILKEMGFRHE